MTEYIVPMGTPQFFHVDTPVTGAGYTWAGAYPYIDTADLAGSYGEINMATTGDSAGQWVGSILPAYTAPAGITGARVDFQINMLTLDAPFHGATFHLDCSDVTSPWHWGNITSAASVAGWNTIAETYLFDPAYGAAYDLPALLAALATGSMFLVAHQSQTGVTFQVSQLRLTLIGSAPIPNQWKQRRDGLGHGGVPMARGNGTRQASNCGRGTF